MDYDNLLRRDLLKIFKNVNTIWINTVSLSSRNYWPISFPLLLTVIEDSNIEMIEIVNEINGKSYRSDVTWLEYLWSKSSQNLKAL